MGALVLADYPQHTDYLRLRDGKTLTVRFARPDDAEALQRYFQGLSARSRYNRFLGAVSELPAGLLNHFIHAGEDDQFSVLAAMMIDGMETIVGEARYGFEPATGNFEFGISVDDRWQGHGIGTALLGNLDCRAAALGGLRMFGDTLRSNDGMMSLARKSGFAFTRHPDDWKLVRFEKEIGSAPAEIPCASWRLVAQQRALAAMVYGAVLRHDVEQRHEVINSFRRHSGARVKRANPESRNSGSGPSDHGVTRSAGSLRLRSR